MILYLAAAEGHQYRAALLKTEADCLISFAYLPNDWDPPYRQKLFLDSGGATARARGKVIDIHEYARYIKLRAHRLTAFANLDTVDVAETQANQALLERVTGLRPVPVYHFSDWVDVRHRGLLEEFIADGHDYIALGGMVERGRMDTQQRIAFFNYCFARTRTDVRLHGFGMRSLEWLLKFPFYSVDSSTFNVGARYGNALFLDGLTIKERHLNAKNLHLLAPVLGEAKVRTTWDDRRALDVHNIRVLQEAAVRVTDVWRKRGVDWDAWDRSHVRSGRTAPESMESERDGRLHVRERTGVDSQVRVRESRHRETDPTGTTNHRRRASLEVSEEAGNADGPGLGLGANL